MTPIFHTRAGVISGLTVNTLRKAVNTSAALQWFARPPACDSSGKVLQKSAFTQYHTCHYQMNTFFLDRQKHHCNNNLPGSDKPHYIGEDLIGTSAKVVRRFGTSLPPTTMSSIGNPIPPYFRGNCPFRLTTFLLFYCQKLTLPLYKVRWQFNHT